MHFFIYLFLCWFISIIIIIIIIIVIIITIIIIVIIISNIIFELTKLYNPLLSYTINIKYTVYTLRFRIQEWGSSYGRPNYLPSLSSCFKRI